MSDLSFSAGAIFGDKVTPLGQQHTAASVGATTNETTLYTLTLPAMGPNDMLDVRMLWSYTNSANNKTLKLKLGTTTLLNSVQTTTATTSAHRTVRNRNSAASQVSETAGTVGPVSTTSALVTATEDTASGTLTLTATGQKASAGETLTLESITVVLIKGVR